MCVILVCPPQVRPDFSILKACGEANPHGAGIAWRTCDSVAWLKTNDVSEIHRLSRSLQGEIVIHFRIASVGRVCPELRHPFPVERKARLCAAGHARAVLFQNGTWRTWRNAIEFARSEGHTPPSGEMSDTRAASWLCSMYHHRFLEQCGKSRWVFFSRRTTVLYGQWFQLSGVSFSNLHWVG